MGGEGAAFPRDPLRCSRGDESGLLACSAPPSATEQMGTSALAFVAIGTVVEDEIACSGVIHVVLEDKPRFCLI